MTTVSLYQKVITVENRNWFYKVRTLAKYFIVLLIFVTHFGFRLNLNKCVFESDHINFLGHHTDANVIIPLLEKIKTITDFSEPASIKQLRCFIGMINFYRYFIPNCSTILTVN